MIIEAGQVAVVTGAASGIGRALAGELSGRGVSVVLADVQEDLLTAAAETLNNAGGSALAVPTDVSDPESVQALADRTLEHFGRVDLVANNAGIAGTSHTAASWDADLADWHDVINVNLFGVLHGIRAFVPHMIAAGRGHVVNTASIAGLVSGPSGGAYGVSKHGVVTLSESLHAELELAGIPVGVSVVCPGFVNTPILGGMPETIQNMDDPNLPEDTRATLEALRGAIEDMLEPEVVARRVLDAVEAGRLHVLPNGDLADSVRGRAQRIIDAIDA